MNQRDSEVRTLVSCKFPPDRLEGSAFLQPYFTHLTQTLQFPELFFFFFMRTMATSSTSVEDTFCQEVTRLRAKYQVKRQKSNAFPPAGRPILDMELVSGKEPAVGIWYDNGTELGQYVRLFDLPDTLSGNILRLEHALPAMEGHFEIKGDIICSLDECLNHPAPVEDDFEDVSDLVSKLPVVAVDSSKHFTKKGKYRSEIENLLKCQGGSCPGAIFSPYLLRLLGASPDGQLVFETGNTRTNSGTLFLSRNIHAVDSPHYRRPFLSPFLRYRAPRSPHRQLPIHRRRQPLGRVRSGESLGPAGCPGNCV